MMLYNKINNKLRNNLRRQTYEIKSFQTYFVRNIIYTDDMRIYSGYCLKCKRGRIADVSQ